MVYVEEKEKMAEEARLVPWAADDVLTVAAFICWHDKNAIWGARRRNEAFESFCRLVGIKDPARIYEIIRGMEDKYD